MMLGSGGPQPAFLPRCFAAVASCEYFAATVPTYETREPRVQSLASGSLPGSDMIVFATV